MVIITLVLIIVNVVASLVKSKIFWNERGFYLKKIEEKLEEASTLSRRLRKRKDIQYAEINPKRKNSTTCASVGSDAHDVSATSNVSDVCAPSSIKTIMSIANICNLSNVTPKLSAFGFKEAFEPTVQLYPEDTSVSIQETPAPLKCCLWASAYTKSTDDDKCVRCFRHFKIFNLVWPLRSSFAFCVFGQGKWKEIPPPLLTS